VKRAFDLLFCLASLPLAGPAILLLSAYVFLSVGFPIFYKQERIGRGGAKFRLYKLRTMRTDSSQILSRWLADHAEDREEWHKHQKLRNDPRVTAGGRFLRKTSFDELPQILNIFRGEMSLVGPRPVTEAELEKYGERVGYYMAAVPGLTGLWQISGRCNVSYDERVELDETYVRTWSFWKDLLILARTPRSVFRGDGAC